MTTHRDRSWKIAALTCAVASVLALTACASLQPENPAPEMDKGAVTAAIEDLSGVDSADVGAFSAGSPDDYGLRVTVAVDDAGYEKVGEVVTGTVNTVAASAGGYSSYDFEVVAPDPEGSGDAVVLTLSRYRDVIDLPVGSYLGSTLTLTSEELRQLSR